MIGDHEPQFARLAGEIARRAEGEAPCYVANPGNVGDAMIREGTLRLFERYGIEFDEHVVSRDAPPPTGPRRRLGLWGGGGAWCRFWDHSSFVREWAAGFESVLVLPSTYDRRFSIPNACFYARDRFESLVHMPEAAFCHDLAFMLEPRPAGPGRGEGWFFRRDREGVPGRVIPEENLDIGGRGHSHTPTDAVFEVLASYAVVHTDRLHVGIAACLLDREVHLYPSAYFKIPAVYRSSMQGRFRGLHLHR